MQDCENKVDYNSEDVKEISILDILLILAESKRLILALMLVFMLCGGIYAFIFNKPEYVSTLQVAPVMPSMTKAGEFNVSVSSGLVRGIMQSDAVLDYAVEKTTC